MKLERDEEGTWDDGGHPSLKAHMERGVKLQVGRCSTKQPLSLCKGSFQWASLLGSCAISTLFQVLSRPPVCTRFQLPVHKTTPRVHRKLGCCGSGHPAKLVSCGVVDRCLANRDSALIRCFPFAQGLPYSECCLLHGLAVIVSHSGSCEGSGSGGAQSSTELSDHGKQHESMTSLVTKWGAHLNKRLGAPNGLQFSIGIATTKLN
jgi:hypothetical protein